VRERQIRDYAERAPGEIDLQGVGVHDEDARIRRETAPQGACEIPVELDGDETSGPPCKLERENTGAGADLYDEVAACDPGVANEISSEAPNEEVPTPRTR
jgi:hypothetical protein